VLERAAILSDDGVIERRHLSLHAKTVPPAAATVPPASANDLTAMERQTIENALRQTDWNKAKAARRLGLTRTQLYVTASQARAREFSADVARLRQGYGGRGSRHEILEPLRLVPQPRRIVRGTVEDGRGLEGLELAARGRRGGS
jgi:hypothetical protein